MTNSIIADIESLIAKLKESIAPAVETAETDVVAAGKSALDYIKVNGLQDLYQIALTLISGATAGAPWAGTLAAIASQAAADGKDIITGAEAVVAAQAQADLIAAGKLLPPAAVAS